MYSQIYKTSKSHEWLHDNVAPPMIGKCQRASLNLAADVGCLRFIVVQGKVITRWRRRVYLSYSICLVNEECFTRYASPKV